MNSEKHQVKLVETKDGSTTLFSELFQTTYHSTDGSVEESMHVFIGNGLNYCLNSVVDKEIHILEIGFGTGLNALLTLMELVKYDVTIHYHTIELYPLWLESIEKLNFTQKLGSAYDECFKQMHLQEWNTTSEISKGFYLTKILKSIEDYSTDAKFDLIYFDAFSPKEQPELWTETIFNKMYSFLKTKGSLVTYCAQGQMKRNMRSVGFKTTVLPGFGSKREMTRAEKH